MRRISVISLMAFTLLLISAGSAFGQVGGELVIPIDTWIEAPTGTLVPLADVETPPDLVGSTCTGLAVAENGTSVHPNNDIILETGGSTTVLYDVEGSSGKITPAAGEVTLGDRVVLTLVMGDHGQFSGGLVVLVGSNCTPPTTTTTTTQPPPTTTQPPIPSIDIDKYAPTSDEPLSEWGYYGSDGIGYFLIVVHNDGKTALTDVSVTDVLQGVGDKTAECGKLIGDLAIDESYSYTCTIAGLDYATGVIYINDATVVGYFNEEEVTDTDPATVSPPKDVVVTTTTSTTLAPVTTQAPTTTSATEETLPVTGASTEQMRGLGIAGIALVLAGIVTLGGATLVGQYRKES